jgi:hypothetical protein
MKTQYHLLVSAILSLLFYPDISLMIICFLAGWAIDIDHLIDYYIFYRHKKLNLRQLLEGKWHENKVIVLFHSWELFIACGIYVLAVGGSLIVTAFATGYGIHLLMDWWHMRNRVDSKFYCLLYRIHNRFDMKVQVS